LNHRGAKSTEKTDLNPGIANYDDFQNASRGLS
jgi:hypothetical protein